MTYRIVALSGPHEGMTHVIHRRVTTIGRDPRNPVQLLDEQVSREHCQLEMEEGSLALQDLQSTNGSFVNGKRITRCLLSPGDDIIVGKTLFKLQGISQETRREAAVGDHLTLVADRVDEPREIHVAIEKDAGRYAKPGQVAPEGSNWQRMCSDLSFLFETASLLCSAKHLPTLLEALTEATFKAFQPDRAYIFLADEETHKLVPRASKTKKAGGGAEIKVSKTVMDTVIQNKSSILSVDAMSDKRWKKTDSIAALGLCSTLCAPLLSGEKLVGLFQIDSLSPMKRFSEDDLHVFTAMSHQAGPVIENLLSVEKQRRAFDSFVEALAATIDARDKFTAGHSAKVMEVSLGIGEAMGLDEGELEVIRYAALLHDYGNVIIPEAVLCKEGELTPAEFDQIKEHARWTREILSKVEFPESLREVPNVACHHHERMTGGGYPDGLKGEQIPLGSRIIAVADLFDSLTSGRSYREAFPPDMAMGHIEKSKGNHLDGPVVEAFQKYRLSLQEHADGSAKRDAGSGETHKTP